MDNSFVEMMASLREGQTGLDEELRPLLQAQNPDWSMLERLRDVADEYAERARQLRGIMTERGADDEALDEVDELCRYFDSTAGLIAQETGDAEVSEDTGSLPSQDEAGRG